MTRDPIGTLSVVLHTHLPWVAGHGTWPVGEEWLHQAWSASYLPLLEVLHDLADEGRRDLLTLGLTPVLSAQLDDPTCLREHHQWLGRWRLRAEELAGRRGAGRDLRDLATHEFRAAGRALDTLRAPVAERRVGRPPARGRCGDGRASRRSGDPPGAAAAARPARPAGRGQRPR